MLPAGGSEPKLLDDDSEFGEFEADGLVPFFAEPEERLKGWGFCARIVRCGPPCFLGPLPPACGRITWPQVPSPRGCARASGLTTLRFQDIWAVTPSVSF